MQSWDETNQELINKLVSFVVFPLSPPSITSFKTNKLQIQIKDI